jgi:ParB family chromosome partitioning protein
MGGADAEVSGAVAPDTVLPLDDIRPNKGQPRKNFDEQALEELADSIKQNGVLQPILVRKKGQKYEIVAGERRYQASKKAGMTDIPVVVKDISDEDVFKLALIENLQRSDLDPIEEAQGFKTLIDKSGMTQAQLGQALSKSRPAIANALRLLDLPKEVQQMMSERKLTAGHARAILAVPSEEGRIKLAQKVVDDGLTVRQTETLAPLFSGMDRQPPKRVPTPQSYKRAARQLRLALDTNVKVKRLRNKNKIEIEFATEEDLARLVEQLSKVAMGGGDQHEDA